MYTYTLFSATSNVGVSHFSSTVIYVGVGQANCHSLISVVI